MSAVLSIFRVTGMIVEMSFGHSLSFVYLLPVKVIECLHLFSVAITEHLRLGNLYRTQVSFISQFRKLEVQDWAVTSAEPCAA